MQNWGLNNWLRNPVCKISFLGWESTTTQLQRAGWSIAAEEDVMGVMFSGGPCIRLALHHERAGLYLVTDRENFDYYRLASGWSEDFMEQIRHLVFRVIYAAPRIETLRVPDDFSRFSPIDALPMYESVEREVKRIEDYRLFRPLDKMKDIIVDPNSVPELMQRILEIQMPEQQAIRERARKAQARHETAKKFDEVAPAQQIHAQIITLAV
jgi:hypothetical protein